MTLRSLLPLAGLGLLISAGAAAQQGPGGSDHEEPPPAGAGVEDPLTVAPMVDGGPVAPDAGGPQGQASPPQAPPPRPPPDHHERSAAAARELLRQAIELYVVGRYGDAAARLRPLVETQVLRDRADQLEALRAYGNALFLSGSQAGAERAFRDLLRLSPGERMDPTFVRPEVVAFFEDVRRRYQLELAREVRRQGPQGTAVANLLPPWGQLQNGHRAKAYTILGGELLFAAASITTAALLYSWADDKGRFGEHEEHYTPVFAVNVASFSALCALVLYGVVDGLYYYYRGPRVPSGSSPGQTSATLPGLISF